jgi:hypothetical protein
MVDNSDGEKMSDKELSELKKMVDELLKRIEKLKKKFSEVK